MINKYNVYDLDKIKEVTIRAVDKTKLSVASYAGNIPQTNKNIK